MLILHTYGCSKRVSKRKSEWERKVQGTENPADMITKGLSGEEIAKYVERPGMGYKKGRSELASKVHQIINKTICVCYNSTSSKITHRVRVKQCSNKLVGDSECPKHSHSFDTHGVCENACGCVGCRMFLRRQ